MDRNFKYFKENNVDAILLSNIIDLEKSFTQHQDLYGTLEELKKLIKTFRDEEIKVIIDFMPNYISEKSNWFIKSEQDDPDYRDYFVWLDTIPNNNWVQQSY